MLWQVECSVAREEATRRNQSREESRRYSEEVMQALMDRYEAPNSRNRWDNPLLVVSGDEVPLEGIHEALFSRNAPPPNLSTQSVGPINVSNLITPVDMYFSPSFPATHV